MAHLLPAINAVDRERPSDPLTFIAFHLLENKDVIRKLQEL